MTGPLGHRPRELARAARVTLEHFAPGEALLLRLGVAATLTLVLGACTPRRSVAGDVFASVGGQPLREPAAEPVPELRRGTHRLSLETAVVMGLEGSPDLAVRRLDPAIAGTFEAIARAEFGVTVFADGRHGHERSRETNRATMMQFDVEGSRSDAIVGLRQRTPTGTAIETTLGFRRDESNRSPEQQEARIGLTVTQSLLRGIAPDVNLARVRQAELETRATEYQLRAFVSSFLVELETNYWQLALASRQLAIHEQSLALAEREAAAVAARIEVGDLAPVDAPVVQAQVARRQQDRIDARAAVESWRLRLSRMLRLDPDRSTIEVTDDLAIEPRPLEDVSSHLELALRLRPDLNEARMRLEQNRLETIVTGHGLLPRLDVFVQLTKTGFGSSFGEAVRGLEQPTFEIAAGLSFEQLLGNAAAAAADRQSHLSHERAERAVENLESLVQLDVSLAINELERARAQIAASRQTAELQAQVVRAERERLDAGDGTPLLLAQAERDLIEAQVAEVAALVGYRIALVRLYAAEGSLLERRGVALAAEPTDT